MMMIWLVFDPPYTKCFVGHLQRSLNILPSSAFVVKCSVFVCSKEQMYFKKIKRWRKAIKVDTTNAANKKSHK